MFLDFPDMGEVAIDSIFEQVSGRDEDGDSLPRKLYNYFYSYKENSSRRRKRSANITPIKPARIYPSKDISYNGVSAGRAFKTPKEAIIAKSKDQTKGVN